MIIKSLSRKSATFKQLIKYIEWNASDNEPFSTIHHNFLNPYNFLSEFYNNAELLPQRANWNILYHEILSITKSNWITPDKHKEAFNDIVKQYIHLRASNNLVYCQLHEEPWNFHFHIVISANEVDSNKRLSLKKHEFNSIRKKVEEYALKRYPDLNQDKVYTKETGKRKKRNAENQIEQRWEKTKKTILIESLIKIFEGSENKDDFYKKLIEHKLEIYARWKTIGILDTDDKKYRLKTLGLLDEFNKMSKRFEEPEKLWGKKPLLRKEKEGDKPKIEQILSPIPAPVPTAEKPAKEEKLNPYEDDYLYKKNLYKKTKNEYKGLDSSTLNIVRKIKESVDKVVWFKQKLIDMFERSWVGKKLKEANQIRHEMDKLNKDHELDKYINDYE